MSRTLPRWMREAQRRILAKPELTESPVCPDCGRSFYLSDWNVAAGRCVECATPRTVDDALDSSQPFCEEDK